MPQRRHQPVNRQVRVGAVDEGLADLLVQLALGTIELHVVIAPQVLQVVEGGERLDQQAAFASVDDPACVSQQVADVRVTSPPLLTSEPLLLLLRVCAVTSTEVAVAVAVAVVVVRARAAVVVVGAAAVVVVVRVAVAVVVVVRVANLVDVAEEGRVFKVAKGAVADLVEAEQEVVEQRVAAAVQRERMRVRVATVVVVVWISAGP